MKIFIRLWFLLVVSVSLWAEDPPTPNIGNPGRITEVAGDYLLQDTIPVDVKSVRIQEYQGRDLLVFDVVWEEYSQGEFQVLWNGTYLESEPEQVDLHLIYRPAGRPSGEKIPGKIAFVIGWRGPLGINVYQGPDYRQWLESFQYRFDEMQY